MKRAKILAAVIYTMLVMGTMTFVHFPELQADEADAKVGMGKARETALRAVPGTVKDSELEREHGRLVYSFEITPSDRQGSAFENEPRKHRGIVEVNVNAMDGSIVNVHREHAGRDRRVEQCRNIETSAQNGRLAATCCESHRLAITVRRPGSVATRE